MPYPIKSDRTCVFYRYINQLHRVNKTVRLVISAGIDLEFSPFDVYISIILQSYT
jgi:hypothetical protein